MVTKKTNTQVEIVPVQQADKFLLDMLSGRELTNEALQAISVLSTPEAPEYAIQTHPGKGGKIMSYLSHVWVSSQLNAAFGPTWGMNVDQIMVHADKSVSAIVHLYIDFPKRDGGFYRRTVAEVGAFDGGGGKMTTAMMVASAVSRGLVKCVYRMFRLGENLYAETPEPTLKSAWESILKMGLKRGLTLEQVVDVIKRHGIKREELLDRFVEAYRSVYEETVNKGDVPEM